MRRFQAASRRIAFAGVLAFCFLFTPSQALAGWQLVWSDEFSGTNVAPGKWTFDIGNGNGGWGNNELEYYTSRPANVYVSDGLLHIVARKENYQGYSYTSAKLKTQGLFSKRYGRFEFRVKLPQGKGYWPALWLMPRDSVYGGWAASGEVDIMENKGRIPTNVMGTLHYGGPYPNQDQSNGPSYTFTGGDSVTNFHVYAMEWTTNQFRWYVDNKLYQTQTSWWSSGGPYPAPFDQPFYILMNLAVGGKFDGNPDASTPFPGDMQVDYVRVYDWVTPPTPTLRLRVPFDDAPGLSTTPSDTSGGGADVSLQMTDGSGAAADDHGAAGSGVAGWMNGARALDFSCNGANQPGIPGPVAATTNANLGFGNITNFIVTCWFKQNALMAGGANVGPRLFVLGGGAPPDTDAGNTIGVKFQSAGQLAFQINGISTPFSLNPQTNNWVFVAAVYDGMTLSLYQGTEGAAASLSTNVNFSTNVDFGASGALYIGNRQDRQRSFDGFIDDFRFYTGAADVTFVENVRLLAARPPWGLTAAAGDGQVSLGWGATLGAKSYNVKRAAAGGGPYTNLPAGVQVDGTAFTDLTATNGTTWYYVVSANNPAGEGAVSAPVSALPGASSPLVLSVQVTNNSLTLGWSTGTLQSAYQLTGPWQDVSNAVSPLVVWPVAPQQFFRLR